MEEFSQPQSTPLSIGAVARDVAIIWVLTFAGGVIAGVAGGDPSQRMIAIAVSNILFSIIGFIIVGCLVGGRRWKHLFVVTFILWVTSLVNILFGVGLGQWLFALPLTLILMGIGGGISYIFRR